MQANCPSPTDRRFRNPYLKVYETGISSGRGGACSSSCRYFFTLKKQQNCMIKMQSCLFFSNFSANSSSPSGWFFRLSIFHSVLDGFRPIFLPVSRRGATVTVWEWEKQRYERLGDEGRRRLANKHLKRLELFIFLWYNKSSMQAMQG